jgi:hypothetical protein
MTIEKIVSTNNPTSESRQMTMRDFRKWVKNELPRWNNNIIEKRKNVDEFIAEVRPWARVVIQQFGADETAVNLWQARQAIQLLGFTVCSAERHFQALGFPAGSGLASLPGVEELLFRLSKIGKTPPVLSHYGYWLENLGKQRLSFTGDPQELVFNTVVVNTDRLYNATLDPLRQICTGKLEISSPRAVRALQYTKMNLEEAHEEFKRFMEKNPYDGKRAMEPIFFLMNMRLYLVKIPVYGEPWAGVNAANMASQMQLDYLLGCVYPWYEGVVASRWKYMTKEDQEDLEKDKNTPSVFQRILEPLGLTPETILTVSTEQIQATLSEQPPNYFVALLMFLNAVGELGRLSAYHWQLIQTYIVKIAKSLSTEQKAGMPVNPDLGTSGVMTHEETFKIGEMRWQHQGIEKLASCLPGLTETKQVY